MSAVAYTERFRQLCVEHRGRLRAGSYNHASAWPLLDGCFSRCLDAGDERRRVRPRTRPRKGRTARSSRSAGRPASSTTGHGPSGGTASHGTSRCTGIPSPGHGAATGHGATSGAAFRLTATAPDPTFRCSGAAGGPSLCCTIAASCPARRGTAARIPSGADNATASGHGGAACATYRRPLAPQRTAGCARAAVAAGSDRTARATAPAASPAAPADGAAAAT